MATAREQAQTNLGPIEKYVNYSGYEKERQLAQDTYNSTLQTMKNEYDTLMNTLNTDRQKLSKDFSSGRSTVSDYYDQQRLLSGTNRSRVLKGTGLGDLGQVVNRMRVGNELSNTANTYYNGIDDVNAKIRAGELDYDIRKRTAQNDLDAALADIGARQKERENDYAKQLAALAEQIQARWDSNRNAQAALDFEKEKAAREEQTAEDDLRQKILDRVYELAGTDYTSKDYDSRYAAAFRYYKFMYPDATDEQVTDALYNRGVYAPTSEEVLKKKVNSSGRTSDKSILEQIMDRENALRSGKGYWF